MPEQTVYFTRTDRPFRPNVWSVLLEQTICSALQYTCLPCLRKVTLVTATLKTSKKVKGFASVSYVN
jgi:hypothetical protein